MEPLSKESLRRAALEARKAYVRTLSDAERFLLEQRLVQEFLRIHLVAAGQEPHCLIHALGCIQKPVASRILAKLRQNGPNLFNHSDSITGVPAG